MARVETRVIYFSRSIQNKLLIPILLHNKRNKRIYSDKLVDEKVTHVQSNVELGVRGNAVEKEFHICITNLLDVEVYNCIINKCIWQ